MVSIWQSILEYRLIITYSGLLKSGPRINPSLNRLWTPGLCLRHIAGGDFLKAFKSIEPPALAAQCLRIICESSVQTAAKVDLWWFQHLLLRCQVLKPTCEVRYANIQMISNHLQRVLVRSPWLGIASGLQNGAPQNSVTRLASQFIEIHHVIYSRKTRLQSLSYVSVITCQNRIMSVPIRITSFCTLQ